MKVAMVLHEPRDIVNIAVVIRAMRNFGQRQLRLVSPAEFDPRRIEGIAHKSSDTIKRVEIFEDLDSALGEFTHVVGLTARGRTVKRNVQRPAEAAAALAQQAEDERIAILFGPEDRGLTNADLDRCHRIVTIETTPEHSSLNLAQAATVMLYELFKAGGAVAPFKEPRREAPPADRWALEQLFEDIERSLSAIEFFKSRTNTSIMRSVRELAHRTPLDAREVGLLRAMALEVVNYLERRGVRSS
jgi:TrmH family RNA methyltransferase